MGEIMERGILPDLRCWQFYGGQPMCCHTEVWFSVGKKRFSLDCYYCRTGMMIQKGQRYHEFPTDNKPKLYFEIIDTVVIGNSASEPEKESVLENQVVSGNVEDTIAFVGKKSGLVFVRSIFKKLLKMPLNRFLLDVLAGRQTKQSSMPFAQGLGNILCRLEGVKHPLAGHLRQALCLVSAFDGKIDGSDSSYAHWHHYSCYNIQCWCHFCKQSGLTESNNKHDPRPIRNRPDGGKCESSQRGFRKEETDFDAGTAAVVTIATGSPELGIAAGLLSGD